MENLDSFWPYMIHLLASFLYFFLSFTEKLDGLPEAGLRRFMRMTRNPLKNHSNKEFEKKLYDFHMKVCGWQYTYILLFRTPAPTMVFYFGSKKCKTFFFVSSTIVVVLAKALSLWYKVLDIFRQFQKRPLFANLKFIKKY